MIVTDEPAALFIAEHLGFTPCPPFTVMGIERDGEITGACLFNQFEGANVHVSAAGKGWTLPFMRALGDYVYRQLRCERMSLTTENEAVARYAERLGGKREGVLRSHFGKGRDGIIIGVLREEYAYLKD